MTSNPGLLVSKKTAIDIIAADETYQNLSTFTDLKQLNETVRQYKELLGDQLNKTHIAVLDSLRNYSANAKKKTLGVSWRTKNNIAKDLGKTRRTIIRVCKYLESLGIIRQYDMKRPGSQYQTCNAIVIQPLTSTKNEIKNQNVTQAKNENLDKSTFSKTKMSHHKNKSYTLKQNIKTYKERKASASSSVSNNFVSNLSNLKANELDGTFTASYVPKEFVAVVKPCIDNALAIEDLWKSVYLDTRYIASSIVDKETITLTAISAFKQSVRAHKIGKVKSKLAAYFTGTFKRMMDKVINDAPVIVEEEESFISETPIFTVAPSPVPGVPLMEW